MKLKYEDEKVKIENEKFEIKNNFSHKSKIK